MTIITQNKYVNWPTPAYKGSSKQMRHFRGSLEGGGDWLNHPTMKISSSRRAKIGSSGHVLAKTGQFLQFYMTWAYFAGPRYHRPSNTGQGVTPLLQSWRRLASLVKMSSVKRFKQNSITLNLFATNVLSRDDFQA